MDKIKIKGIKVYANHGLFDSEKILGQEFVVDCCMCLDISNCSERIEKTAHYGDVTMDIVKYMKENRFDLLETLANSMSKYLLLKYPIIRELELSIHKPQAPIPTVFSDIELTVVRKRVSVYLGVGSNLGDRVEFLDMAIDEIMSDDNIKLVRKSSYIETAPYGVLDQPNFLNGVLQVETIYTPQELLEFCHRVEEKSGRIRERVWGERTLDVDILLYGDEIIFTEHLKIPHPELHMREFVLKSMKEVAPYLIHPVYKKNMLELYKELDVF